MIFDDGESFGPADITNDVCHWCRMIVDERAYHEGFSVLRVGEESRGFLNKRGVTAQLDWIRTSRGESDTEHSRNAQNFPTRKMAVANFLSKQSFVSARVRKDVGPVKPDAT